MASKKAMMAVGGIVFFLSACGDGGIGGVTSAPVPTPTPTPTASYTKLADMNGDRTFQTAGIQYNAGPGINFTQPQSLAFGSGIVLGYTAASDTYTLTAPGGATASFAPQDVVTNPQPPAGSLRWQRTNGTFVDSFQLTTPIINGVPLSYMAFGTWAHIDTTTNNAVVRLGYGGSPTLASDMPRSGTANYAVAAGGALAQGSNTYTLNGNSSATFSANFAANSVSTSLTLAGTLQPNGTTVTSFGTYSGTGTISGNGISGAISGGSMTGNFSGAFFGPQALEFGFAWYMGGTIGGTATNAVGGVTGIKQ